MLSDSLKAARKRAGISPELLSELAKVPLERVFAWEEAQVEPSPEEADSVARAFGVRVADLRGAGGWPLERLLFRAREERGLAHLAETGSWQVIGEFLRAVADTADLETRGRAALPRLEAARLPLGDVAEALARDLRRELGREPTAPIESMRALVGALDIQVFFTTPSELDRSVDGVSTRVPRPAILVNLIEGPSCWWRTRMTLAHELCHLLVDHAEEDAAVSTSYPRSQRLFAEYDDVERRANAFAACLLAPREAVRARLHRVDPTSEAAIESVAKHFGLGRTTAINRIEDVFGLDAMTREAMLARSRRWWDGGNHPDAAPHVGIRAGAVLELTTRAFAEGRIDALRARALLALPLTEPLPPIEGVPPERLAPLRPQGDRARRAAQTYLHAHERRADLVAGEAVRTDYGWCVPIEGEDRHVRVSFDMRVETPGT